jgi:hypothetical protein
MVVMSKDTGPLAGRDDPTDIGNGINLHRVGAGFDAVLQHDVTANLAPAWLAGKVEEFD